MYAIYRVFFFAGPPLKQTKSKIMLEYPDWAFPKSYMDWASLKITKFFKCQTGPPLKSSLDGGNSPESLINWILGEAQSDT